MLSNKIACFLALVLPLIAVAAADPTTRVTIHEDERFCLLLPPSPGSDIADSLEESVSYCTSRTPQVRYANDMPSGFIKTHHYAPALDLSYSQVTGTIDPAAFSLSTSDSGGMASRELPSGAQCIGYRYFIQFVEPDAGVFCLRCCHRESDCPTDQSDKGCKIVIPGDYS
ncbi:MAG: hypothetical protein J3Q66DRAFT_284605 [Benniella sp.]|nr:MAG: hypothetical protein J3Q66DRAFT_284605 [Benniella sp.]